MLGGAVGAGRGWTAASTISSAPTCSGAFHCLELARRDDAFVVFLSTSRVYPVAALDSVAYVETRHEIRALTDEQSLAGVSRAGIAEDVPSATVPARRTERPSSPPSS